MTASALSPNASPPQLLVMEADGEWIACMPVRSMRPLGFSTWRHAYSFVGTPLVDRSRLADFAEALVSDLGGGRLDQRFMVLWEAVDLGITEAIRSATSASRSTRVIFERKAERAALERSPDPDAHLSHLKRKRRRELERKREQLSEKLESELEVKTYSGEPDLVEEFLRLEADGWKGKEGTAMSTAGDGDVFRAICDGFAGQERLQILTLEAGDRVVAMQCNISAGDTLFCFKIAFDERYRQFAPGIQLEIDSMLVFRDSRAENVLDTCGAPASEFLNRLWPDRRQTTIMVIGPGGPVGKVAGRLLDAAQGYKSKRRQS